MVNRFNTPNVQFFANPVTGAPLAGGLLYFYATGSATPQNTYSDSGLTTANTNPVVLDSNGFANNVFLQNLAYKVVLKDSLGNLIWTADPVDTSDFSGVAQFAVNNGTPNGTVAGTAGTPGGLPSSVIWDYTNNILYICTTTGTTSTAVWTAVNASATTAVVVPPQGYLTLTSGTPVIPTDVTGATAVYYTPFVGSQIPVFNGASMIQTVFTELTMTLTASQTANTIYDLFVFSNSGVLTLVSGPAWTTSTAGSGARGTGASTTQISRVSGIWVNTVQISGKNGSTTYTIGANLATYVGSIFMDATAGQITCHRTWGQNRKWGVSNAYNRVPVNVQAGDSTASWNYGTATIRASNAVPASWTSNEYNVGSGTACNGIVVLCGLQEEIATVQFLQSVQTAASGAFDGQIGIGLNSTTAFSGSAPTFGGNNSSAIANGRLDQSPFLGINTFQALEKTQGSSPTNVTYAGTQPQMTLTLNYRA